MRDLVEREPRVPVGLHILMTGFFMAVCVGGVIRSFMRFRKYAF